MLKKMFLVVSLLLLTLASLGITTPKAEAAYYNDSVLVQGSANFSGYSVPVEDYYLTRADAIKLGDSLAPSSSGWSLVIISFFVNRYVGATLGVSFQQATDLAGQIKKITDSGGAVWMEVRKDPVWGTKTYIRNWNNNDSWSLKDLSQGRYQYQNYNYEIITSISPYYAY